MGQALDAGREVFLTGLDLLADTRATYDREPEHTKTLLTKTIFGKLYLDADPDGTVTHADLGDPFQGILDTAHSLTPADTPEPAAHRRHQGPQSPLRPLATTQH